ncbi:Hypothetical_protein [Hexamita inflata]|uniref:Hypothetical_protein n=1 Tax=Hexamita inflata TaxID=28002 RepID=A0AA86R242_9EUKA|nr:Hypothetical protein HINF_LOCUS51909 [Hexamita inflata]
MYYSSLQILEFLIQASFTYQSFRFQRYHILCQNSPEQSRIVHLENESQSLQSTLNDLRDQIEKLNIQEYQKRIDLQIKQLEDKDEYIEKLKEEIEKINVDWRFSKVLMFHSEMQKIVNITSQAHARLNYKYIQSQIA